MKEDPFPSQEGPRRVLTGQSSITSKVQALLEARAQGRQSEFQSTKKDRMAEKRSQKIKQGIMQEDPPLTLEHIYEGNLQRSNLLKSFNLSKLKIIVYNVKEQNKHLCLSSTFKKTEQQRKYRIFLHMCVMRAIQYLYDKQCKQSKLQVQIKFFKILKMFQFILESLLDDQEINYTQFQLENCQLEVALRWTMIYLAFREFYQQLKKQQICNTGVQKHISDKILVSKSKWALFSVRKSKIYKYEQAVKTANYMIDLIKQSKLLAMIYKRFVKKVWKVQMDLHKILTLNWSTQFLFIDFIDEKDQGLTTTHNDKFYSFINMLQILNKIEFEDENEEENEDENRMQNQNQIQDQEPINKQLRNLIKMYVFVVISRELARSFVRKAKIPQVEKNDDSTDGILQSQEGGCLFEKFLFGDQVSIVTGQNCEKIQNLLRLKDLSQIQFKSFQSGFPVSLEKQNQQQEDSNEQISKAQINQFNQTISVLKRNIKLADKNFKGTKYEKPIKNIILNETEKLTSSQNKKINQKQLEIQQKMQIIAVNEVANEQQREANKKIYIQGIEALKMIGKTREKSLKKSQIFIGMKRPQPESKFQATTKFHNAIRGSCIPPKYYMKNSS